MLELRPKQLGVLIVKEKFSKPQIKYESSKESSTLLMFLTFMCMCIILPVSLSVT